MEGIFCAMDYKMIRNPAKKHQPSVNLPVVIFIVA